MRGLPGWVGGAAGAVALIVDAVMDPLIGSLSDGTRTRWGRRHPYMYAAAVPMATCFILLFNPPAGLSVLPRRTVHAIKWSSRSYPSSSSLTRKEPLLLAICIFFAAHWLFAIFFQSFFLHRYGAHRHFTMSRAWERVFYLGTFLTQGASFLVPRAYAVLHREHHAFSDTTGDPHSPHVFRTPWRMMWSTKLRYAGLVCRSIQPEPRFEGYPEWALLDRIGDHWAVRIGWGVLYTLFYVAFAPAWAFVLLPVHYLMGPVHGAIVNWCGHKYGYRNYETPDRSRNSLPVDFLTLGELFQNNHHRYGQSPTFAVRWFEVDPTYWMIRVLSALHVVRLERPQAMMWVAAS